MRKITLSDRLRYTFDNLMSRGTAAQIIGLGIITLLFIAGSAAIVTFSGVAVADEGNGPDLNEMIWRSLLRTLDPGTMGGDQGSPPFLGMMLLVTLGGIFIVSTLIGVLTSGIENKIGELRKGHSFVVEQNHTIILGWSPQVFAILSELATANANQRNACVVILADKDKVEMEDEIRAKVRDTKGTRVVCRTGSPLDLIDLEIVNPHTARSIIIVSPETGNPDTQVVKTILALTNNPNRRQDQYHIVAEIRETKNVPVAKMVGRDETEIVLVGDLISRITVQTCRQSGLSVLYTELLNFGGDEIYFKEEPALVGKTFGEALVAYEDSALIGLQRNGSVQLNPPMGTRIGAGDKIIAISEDDDTIRLSGLTDLGIAIEAVLPMKTTRQEPERTLILGWNHCGENIVRELDNYVAPGSETIIVAGAQAEAPRGKNQTVNFRNGDSTDRATLEALELTSFDHIIVLSYCDTLNPQAADAITLFTLLHLRDIAERTGKDLAIVSEMLDVRNRELAEVTHADDFIVSDQLVSLLLTQISENKSLSAVFADLFDPEGAEIYLKPIENYVQTGQAVNFYTLVDAARRRNEIAIGYRLQRDAHNAEKSYGVCVNPDKSTKTAFNPGDRVIVLAES
jgi:voltage-gated potassium channel Kch